VETRAIRLLLRIELVVLTMFNGAFCLDYLRVTISLQRVAGVHYWLLLGESLQAAFASAFAEGCVPLAFEELD
jgi:hypothetical protein